PMPDLAIRCTCGQMQGTARDVGRRSQRLVCYCRDCQCFAWFLERPELLDVHGGSEVLQLNPTRVSFHAGHEHLACMRLSPKGVMRWYASCCNTPIGNTLDKPKPPFVGLLSSCWDPELDAAARDRLIGPRRAYINGPGHAAPDGSMAKVRSGHEHLACMRLSPKGVMRWYASCCNTPIGNTLDKPKPPFVGLLSSCWDPELDAAARDRLIGPRRAYINGPGHAAPDGSMAKV